MRSRADLIQRHAILMNAVLQGCARLLVLTLASMPLFAPHANAAEGRTLEIAGATFSPDIAGIEAPLGFQYVTLDLQFTNRSGAVIDSVALGPQAHVVEDGLFPYFAEPHVGPVDQSALWQPMSVPPDGGFDATLVFAVPAQSGALALIYEADGIKLKAPIPATVAGAGPQAVPEPSDPAAAAAATTIIADKGDESEDTESDTQRGDATVTRPATTSTQPLLHADSIPVERSRSINPNGEEVNVARHDRLSWQTNGSAELIDGDFDHSYRYWSTDGAFVVGFLRPYAIHRIRIGLPPGDDAGDYQYTIEGSLDGADWQMLVDHSKGAHHGTEDLPIRPVRIRILRTRVWSTSGEDAFINVSEVEAYTRDPVPALGNDVAAAQVGGQVLATSAGPGDPRASFLIDGNPANYWYADGVTQPEITIGFHESRTARIHAVALFAEHYNAVPDSQYRPKRVEILASNESAFTGFKSLTQVELAKGLLVSWIPLPETTAKFVKLRVLENFGGETTTIGAVSVFEAPEAESILDAYLVRPIDVVALNTYTAIPELNADRDIASYYNGGRVIAASNGSSPVVAGKMLNDRKIVDSITFDQAPSEITLHFFRERAATVSQVNIHNRSSSSPTGVRELVLEAADDLAGPFRKIGPTYVLAPEALRWFPIKFPPTRMRYLRIRFLSYHTSEASIGDIQVIEARQPGEASILDLKTPEELFPGSRNIAHRLLGGRITTHAESSGAPSWPLANLIDGLSSDGNGLMSPSYGWSTKLHPTLPVDLLFSFAQQRTARIAGIAIDPKVRLGPSDPFHGNVVNWPAAYEVYVSTESAQGPWEKIGRTQELLQRSGKQAIRFSRPVEAKFVLLRILDTFDFIIWEPYVQLGDVEIYEAPEACGQSVASDRPVNLISPGLGGIIARFSSEDRKAWASRLVDSAFVDAGLGDGIWASSPEQSMPQAVTFGFFRLQAARFDRIELTADEQNDVAFRPKRVRVEISTGLDPLKGYVSLGEFDLRDDQAKQTIKLAEPAMARFVRLTFLETFGARQVALREAAIWEDNTCDGYQSVAVIGRNDPVEAVREGSRTRNVMGDVRESEPNDAPAEADPAAIGARVAGILSPNTDVDYFAMDSGAADKPELLVRLQGDPVIRTDLSVEDLNGKVVGAYKAGEAATSTTLRFNLPPASYRLRLSQPATVSVVLLFDTSGSMKEEIDAVKKAADQYLQDRAPWEEIALLSFDENVHTIHDFSTDTQSLRRSLEEKLVLDGDTALYDGMKHALELLKDRPGQKAIVLLSDGANSIKGTPLPEIWDDLAAAGVRVFTIALGQELNIYGFQTYDPWSPFAGIGASPAQLLELWSRATGGASFFAPGPEELSRIYRQVSSILRSEPQYALTPLLPRPDGFLDVRASPDSGASAGIGNIALILDASGSMGGKNVEGLPKIQAAKTVMHRLVMELPDSARIGLRVYGHRLPKRPKEQSCLDTELVVPIGPIDRAALLKQVDAIQPKGQTPLGLSIALTALDFKAHPGSKVAVLITDGKETCNVSPDSDYYPLNAIRLARAAGVEFRLNIVGFDISDDQTRKFLAAVAGESGGSYYDAETTDELIDSLHRSLALRFVARDSSGAVAAEGQVGADPIALPEAEYVIETASDPVFRIGGVKVISGQTTEISLGGASQISDVGTPAQSSPFASASQATATDRSFEVAAIPPPTTNGSNAEISEIRQAWSDCLAVTKAPSTERLTLYATTPASGSSGSIHWVAGGADVANAGGGNIAVYRSAGTTRFADEHEALTAYGTTMRTRYCFRGDGSIAFIFSSARANGSDLASLGFAGPVRIELRYYFDPAGENIRELAYAIDDTTGVRLTGSFQNYDAFRASFYADTDSLERVLGISGN